MSLNFDRFEEFIRRYHKIIIIIWLVAFVASIPLAVHLFSIVSYNITGGSASNNSSFNSTQLVVTVSSNVYSPQVKQLLFNVSGKFGEGNVDSIYTVEYSVLNSSYTLIKQLSYPQILAAYREYNVTGSTISSTLNDSIISAVASGISSRLENSTEIRTGANVYGFVIGVIKGYFNSTPSYVLSNENFSTYPLLPPQTTLSTLVNGDHNTTLFAVSDTSYSYLSSYISNQSAGGNLTSYVTGGAGLTKNIETETQTGTLLAILLGIIAVIIITGLIFRSPVAAFVPIAIFGVDVTIAYSLFYIVFHSLLHTTISFFDPALTSILMLGVSTDYLVYMLYRYRQERNNPNGKTIDRTIKGAGAAIAVSGTTIIVAYAVLSSFKLAFLGATGELNAIGVFIVLLSAITLLPAMMFLLGDRLLYPNRKYYAKYEGKFRRLADFEYRNRKKIIAIFVVIIAVCLYVFVTIPPGLNFLGLLPNSQAKQAFYVATNNFGYDPIDPISISFSSQNASIATIASHIESIQNVHSVIQSSASQPDLLVYLNPIAFSRPALSAYNNINSYLSTSGLNYTISGTQVFLGSALDSINSTTPTLIIVLGLVIFALLSIILFSLYTPIRLVLLLISMIIAANALTVFLFSFVFSLPFIAIAQVFLITNMMGVGVDYDIFLVMRIRESTREGMKDSKAIKEGLSKSGPIIISIGAIFSIVFFSLTGSGVPIIAEVGFIVGAGILLDSIISITILVPSIMYLLDKYNWWPGNKHGRIKRHTKQD